MRSGVLTVDLAMELAGCDNLPFDLDGNAGRVRSNADVLAIFGVAE